MQLSTAGNPGHATAYQQQIELEQWCRATNARRILTDGWLKAPSNFLAHRLAGLYIEKAREIYAKKPSPAIKYGAVLAIIETDEQLVQVALEALLYVMGNIHTDRSYSELSASIGKRAEYAIWLANPKWQRSWHLEGLKLASHNDLGMSAIVEAFKSKNFRLGYDYKPLTGIERCALGAFFLEIIALSTGMVEIYVERDHKRKTRKVRYTQAYWDFAKRWRENIIMFRPLYMPMIMPPKPWTKHDDGGYMSIVTPCSTVDWSLFNSYISNADPCVLGSLNRLQQEPFRLDQQQIAILRDCYDRNHAIGGLPPSIQLEHPAEVAEQHRTRAEWCDYWAWRADRKLNGLRSRFIHALCGIERLQGHQQLWFVWQLDHRGRAYPRGSQISIAGSDPFRSMLQFDCRSPVKGHERELAWHLGAAMGLPPSHSDRWAWLEANSSLVERIGSAPLDHLAHWAEAKEPWRFLQIARDWASYLAEPGHRTGTVYRLDQTCSGYGHVACLLRDGQLAAFTNVIGARPADLYTGVSRLVRQHVEELVRAEDNPHQRDLLAWWLAHWPGRSLWKVVVMPIVYGRTYMTLRDQINTYLRDELQNFLTEENYRIYELSCLMATIVHGYIKTVLPSVGALSKWLTSVAKVQMQAGQRPSWLTPNGLRVESYRTVGADKDIQAKLSGHTFRVRAMDHSAGVLDRRKSTRQLTADFVHSMDAAFLQRFVCHWGSTLGKPIVTIHDCFGTTLENAASLRAELQGQWNRFYSSDWLAHHHQWVMAQTGQAVATPPCIGSLDPARIGENPFLFS